MIQQHNLIDAFFRLGEGNSSRFTFNAELFAAIQEFTCKLYGQSQCISKEEAQYSKFCKSKKKYLEPKQLPPRSDVLLFI